MEFGIYVPQIVAEYDQLLGLARTAETTGFTSFWLFDHLYGPGAPGHPALEGWTTATALLAHTTTLRVGALVLCNNFRHPALLARMATTLDVISHGRLEFGLGSGSYEQEHHEIGIPWESAKVRSERLGEGLEIITRMFANDVTTFEGTHYTVRDLPNLPRPVQRWQFLAFSRMHGRLRRCDCSRPWRCLPPGPAGRPESERIGSLTGLRRMRAS